MALTPIIHSSRSSPPAHGAPPVFLKSPQPSISRSHQGSPVRAHRQSDSQSQHHLPFLPVPAPPSVLRKEPLAVSADGAPPENTNVQMLPQGELAHTLRQGGVPALGPRFTRPHDKDTQKTLFWKNT